MGSPERANHHYTEAFRTINEHKHGEYRQIEKTCDECGKQFDQDATTIDRIKESHTCAHCRQEHNQQHIS